jgi:ATP-dependent Clp protease ATP-binding subunit ClpB
VVLFDEIEKAHPDVFNSLLQLLDDGRLTDSQGRTVDFKNTVVIMTSNIGSTQLMESLDKESAEIPQPVRDAVMGQLQHHFRPEFLNRIDDVVLFAPLTLEQIERIVDLMLADLRQRLVDRHIDFTTTPAARKHIALQGYDPVFGARPLKRYLQHELETQIARALIAGDFDEGATLVVDTEGGALVVRQEAPSEIAA